MNKNVFEQRKEENRQAFTIAFIYALSCKLFKSSLMQYIPLYDSVFMLFTALSVIFMFGYIMRQYRNRDFSREVSFLVILFLSTLVWGMLFHGQMGYYSIRGVSMNTGPLMVVIFFFLKKYNISMRVLVKAIVIACSMYCIAYLLGTITFPNQIFGYDSNSDKQDSIIGSEQQRGVLRLFILGSQIIPLTIFWVLTYYKNNKRYYFWFVPLFIFLIIQGARTPLFMCFLVVLGYFVLSVKQKILAVLLSIVIAFSIPLLYDKILESNSDDIITNYVKITQQQLENNESEDDIRLEMSKYMFSEFNGSNILQSIFGNGFPDAKSNYSTKLMTLSSNRYYFLSDVGITQIYIYMGIVGLIIYTIVFYRGIKTKVPQKYEFGRLFLVYYALISFTNNAMVEFGMFTFGLALYSIFRANYEMQLESKKNDRISCK